MAALRKPRDPAAARRAWAEQANGAVASAGAPPRGDRLAMLEAELADLKRQFEEFRRKFE